MIWFEDYYDNSSDEVLGYEALSSVSIKGLSSLIASLHLKSVNLLALITKSSSEVVFYALVNGKMMHSGNIEEQGIVDPLKLDKFMDDVAAAVRGCSKFDPSKLNVVKVSGSGKTTIEYYERNARIAAIEKEWRASVTSSASSEALSGKVAKSKKVTVWGRSFNLKVDFDVYKGESVTPQMEQALINFLDMPQSAIDRTEGEVIKYILKRDKDKVGSSSIDNVFKYVRPHSLYIQRSTGTRTVGIMCSYKFNEDGIAVVFKNEKFSAVGSQNIIL